MRPKIYFDKMCKLGLIQINWVSPLDRPTQFSEELQRSSETILCENLSQPLSYLSPVSQPNFRPLWTRLPKIVATPLGVLFLVLIFTVQEKRFFFRVHILALASPHASSWDQLWLNSHIFDHFLPNICTPFL